MHSEAFACAALRFYIQKSNEKRAANGCSLFYAYIYFASRLFDDCSAK